MNALSLWLSQLWDWVAWGNAQLRHVAYYATMVTFLGVVWQLLLVWRQSRPVRVFVVNDDSLARERAPIGALPRRFATRAEINGLVSQAAGGATLDLSRFRFNYKVRSVIEVPLPKSSYWMVVPSNPNAPAAALQDAAPQDVVSPAASQSA